MYFPVQSSQLSQYRQSHLLLSQNKSVEHIFLRIGLVPFGNFLNSMPVTIFANVTDKGMFMVNTLMDERWCNKIG